MVYYAIFVPHARGTRGNPSLQQIVLAQLVHLKSSPEHNEQHVFQLCMSQVLVQ
jgi:hypothetical protein